MKTFLSIGFCIISTVLFAQNFLGKWVGTNKDTSLSIVLEITQGSTGYKIIGDEATSSFSHLNSSKATLKNDSLSIFFPQPLTTLTLSHNAATVSLSGNWVQYGTKQTLQLKEMKRPQTPVPPFNYKIDSLEYDNADKSVHLGATLTRPFGNKKYPVAILITGSGLEDRDETILGHKPFAIIADYLTKQGIAVLRVDDRTKGKSKGNVSQATTFSFTQDLLTSLAFLKTRNDIDTSKIGLIGHSEGGLISYMAYQQWPHFKFIITLAGQGISGEKILLKQGTEPLLNAGISKTAYKAYYKLHQSALSIIAKTNNDSITNAGLKELFGNWEKDYPDSILKEINALNVTKEQYAASMAPFMANKWLNYFIKADPASYLKNIKCPFLILNGDKDMQVYADENVPAIQTALKQANNNNVTTNVLKNINHLFQHCNKGTPIEYGLIEESFAPEVLQIMGNWIKTIALK